MSEGIGRKKVVFISLPMAGLSDEEIRKNIEKAKVVYLAISGMDIRDVAFIDTMDNPDPPSTVDGDRTGVWYLGHSLTKLAQCDEALFWTGWLKARGCQVEHDVCVSYGIPMIFVDYSRVEGV